MKTVQLKKRDLKVEQYKQNRMFGTNQKRLYETTDGVHMNSNEVPNAGDCLEFWNGVWGKQPGHNVNAEWLNKLEKDLKDIEN